MRSLVHLLYDIHSEAASVGAPKGALKLTDKLGIQFKNFVIASESSAPAARRALGCQ